MTTAAPDKKQRAPRFLLNLPDELRTAVERAAFASGRTVTGEINRRLQQTFDAEAPALPAGGSRYDTTPLVTVLHTNEKSPAGALSNIDQAILEEFRRLTPEKQLALLSLLK
jgi:hypothetical protein